MGEGKLAAEEREALRQWCASEGLVEVDEASIIRHHSDADDLTLRLLDERASLERDLANARLRIAELERFDAAHAFRADRDAMARDLAELREAARKLCETATAPAGRSMSTQEHHERLWRWQSNMLAAAKDLAALLPAEPPNGPESDAPLDERYQGPGGGSALMNDVDELLAAEPLAPDTMTRIDQAAEEDDPGHLLRVIKEQRDLIGRMRRGLAEAWHVGWIAAEDALGVQHAGERLGNPYE